MDADEFRRAVARLGVSQGRIAILCGFHRQRGYAWGCGDAPVPVPVAGWLRGLVAYLDQNPPPRVVRGVVVPRH